jgi:uncharacterized membrane protein
LLKIIDVSQGAEIVRFLFVLIALALLIPLPVFAASPEYVFDWIEILADMESGTEEYNMEITCLTGEMEYFDIAGIGALDAASSGGSDLRVESLEYASRIYFERAISQGDGQFIYLKVEGVEPKYMEGDALYFRSFAFPKKVEEFTYTVILPEMVFPEIRSHGMACTENCTCEEGGPCTCENCVDCLTCEVGSWTSATTLDPDEMAINDKRLYLIWKKTLAAGERFQVGITYPEKRSNFLLYLVTFVIALGVVFSAGFLKARSRKRGEVVRVFLNDEEKLVTEFIRERGGEVLQKEIWQAESIGFSRPKVSRIIADLEKRDVIKRKPYKKTFKVILVGY